MPQMGHSRHSRYPGVSGLPRERSVFWAARRAADALALPERRPLARFPGQGGTTKAVYSVTPSDTPDGYHRRKPRNYGDFSSPRR